MKKNYCNPAVELYTIVGITGLMSPSNDPQDGGKNPGTGLGGAPAPSRMNLITK